ncbi:MAG TPA: hypothetical protein VI456_01000 [Polyangia bacterium]
MDDADNRIEVLKEIRDEIRGVRNELAELRGTRAASSGVRTEVVDRAARWRSAAMASSGALAVIVLVLALRAGPRRASEPGAAPPPIATMTPAPNGASAAPLPAPRLIPTPAERPMAQAPIAAPAGAPRPASKPVPRVLASAPAAPAKKRVKPDAAAEAPATAAEDEGDTIPFPSPHRVRVHKMSYGPVESEPAKL